MFVFVSLLCAIFLSSLSSVLRTYTSLSQGWSLLVVVLLLLSLSSLTLWLLAPRVTDQVELLAQRLPSSIQNLEQRIQQYDWGQHVLSQLKSTGRKSVNNLQVFARATDVFSSTITLITGIFLGFILAIYLAVNPQLYLDGFLRLIPLHSRDRIRSLLYRVGSLLWWWLLGRLLGMVIVGVLTGVGLWLLKIPLALTLGLLTALFDFVPFFGPIVAAGIAALLAFPQDALYVVLLYCVVQHLEGWLIIPLIQQRAILLPPALIIIAQVLLGTLLGILGLIIATPLLASLMVFVRELYVKDMLDDSGKQPSS